MPTRRCGTSSTCLSASATSRTTRTTGPTTAACTVYGYKPRRSADEPGSTYDFATTVGKVGEHGNLFHYVSLNTNVLGWVMERVTGTAVPRTVGREIWSQLGGEHDAYIALDGAGSAQLEAASVRTCEPGSARSNDLSGWGLRRTIRGPRVVDRRCPRKW